EANPGAAGTLRESIARIKALDPAPAFIIHTGDITHAQKAGAFETVTEMLAETRVGRVFYVPGENDVFADGGKEYLTRHAAGGPGWQSFDHRGHAFGGAANAANTQS